MQHQKLGFNDPKEPLNNKKARCIGGDYHPCAREPMALPRYEQGGHFQWLNQGERSGTKSTKAKGTALAVGYGGEVSPKMAAVYCVDGPIEP
jgi:hypothetical protein